MNKDFQKQQIAREISQIQSILQDFRKTKIKCLELSHCMNSPMANLQNYKNIEKNTRRKMNLLDHKELVKLKDQLVRTLTDMFQVERELRYKKEKQDARRQILNNQSLDIEYQKQSQLDNDFKSFKSAQSTPIDHYSRSINLQPKKQKLKQEQDIKSKNVQIPLYRAKNQTNQNKLDRISKYVASLKRNFKINSQPIGYKWNIYEYLEEDFQYNRLKTQMQRFKMREEEIEQILANRVQKELKQLLSQSQVLQSRDGYKLIKIQKQKLPKNSFNQSNLLKNSHSSTQLSKLIQASNTQCTKSPAVDNIKNLVQKDTFKKQLCPSPKIKIQSSGTDYIGATFMSPLRNIPSKIQIESKAEQDFRLIKEQLQKSNKNYIDMLSKITQTVEKGSEKLIRLRQKRKKKMEKDNTWNELGQI